MFPSYLLEAETKRLYQSLERVGFSEGYCKIIAPLTLQIRQLKESRNAIILAHSYQTPDIMYGVADFIGDSYQLSQKAKAASADIIVFAGVRFMAETAKILNPSKKILLPGSKAGCSLADSITVEDVRTMKTMYPGRPVVSYVNTSAEVKAESDVCCTSGNAIQIVESFPQKEIIFLPDEFMARNLQKKTSKKLLSWQGRCIVHEDFKAEKLAHFKKKYTGIRILAHSECPPDVASEADFVGGTEGMIHYVQQNDAPGYMMVTECGLSDRMRVEFPEKEFLGTCGLCPYMKQNTLPLIVQVLEKPHPEQIIEIPENIRIKAEQALLKMFELTH